MEFVSTLQDACDNPSPWLQARMNIISLEKISGKKLAEEAEDAASRLQFTYNHVGGLGTNTPRRGVCVMGNQTCPELVLSDKEAITVTSTNWTVSQNQSNCTLTTRTVKMPDALHACIPSIVGATQAVFPDVPISESSFSLFVANEYLPEAQHNICAHTDDQPWYASPPVFASLTYFPDGRPLCPDATYRFQVLDEGTSKPTWKDVFLDHGTICIMRADTQHRVRPPLQKYVKSKQARRRINLTFRNLADPNTDPLGFELAFANHYRYYGIPIKITQPACTCVSSDLLARFKALNPDIEIITDTRDRHERSFLHRKLREQLKDKYPGVFPRVMAGKSNVVLESTERALKLACMQR